MFSVCVTSYFKYNFTVCQQFINTFAVLTKTTGLYMELFVMDIIHFFSDVQKADTTCDNTSDVRQYMAKAGSLWTFLHA